jgi:GWxTD domain-containing protein
MKNSARTIIFSLLLCAHVGAQGLRPNIQPPPGLTGGRVTAQTVAFFSADTAAATINLLFRIPHEFFTFLRQSGDEFRAHGEIVSELFSENGIVIGREFRPVLISQAQGSVAAGSPDVVGALTFTAPPGSFSVSFEVRDLQSERRHFDRAITVRIPERTKTIQAAAPLLIESIVRPLGDSTSALVPLNFGGAIPFGTRAAFALQTIVPDSTALLDVRWELMGKPMDATQEEVRRSGTAWTELRGIPGLHESPGETIVYHVERSSPLHRLLLVPIPSHTLEPGLYTWSAVIRSGSDSTRVEIPCPVVWNDRPMSLGRTDIAIEALRHIASEAEMDELKSLSSSRSAIAFRAFWQKRNPDTTQAYNPVMAEYYRRVDEAIQRYSSTRESDGYRTDQGKIFILYGSPSVIDRKLHPDGRQTETWTYVRLKKRFVFELHDGTGIFILTSTDQW